MRILGHAYGTAGDVLPVVAIGQALRARGHDVRLWTNEAFRHVVEGAGLTWREAGTAEEYAEFTSKPKLWHPVRGYRMVLRHGVLPSIEDGVAALRAEVIPGETAW